MNLNFWNVLCTLVCVGVSEALREGDEGVCIVRKVMRRPETFIDYKMNCGEDGRSKCAQTVKKARYHTVQVQREICCTGYDFLEETDTCQPVCPHGCLGGKCMAPETCHCETPLVLINNKCMPPVCDPPCVNGICTAPNTCMGVNVVSHFSSRDGMPTGSSRSVDSSEPPK